MSKQYRRRPMTPIKGPTVAGKGTAYYKVKSLSNMKAHCYLLQYFTTLLNNMQNHALVRYNDDAPGVFGVCHATKDELVEKAMEQALMCPITRIPLLNKARTPRTKPSEISTHVHVHRLPAATRRGPTPSRSLRSDRATRTSTTRSTRTTCACWPSTAASAPAGASRGATATCSTCSAARATSRSTSSATCPRPCVCFWLHTAKTLGTSGGNFKIPEVRPPLRRTHRRSRRRTRASSGADIASDGALLPRSQEESDRRGARGRRGRWQHRGRIDDIGPGANHR